MECLTGGYGSGSLGASRRPFGVGSRYRTPQPPSSRLYGVLAFDEFNDVTKSLRCLFYLTNRVAEPRSAP